MNTKTITRNGTQSHKSNRGQMINGKPAEQLTIVKSKTFNHKSPMPAELKQSKQNDGATIAELFETTLKQKGEFDPENIKWIDDNTIVVGNLSGTALHSVILKAEEMGRDISYTHQTTIRIS